MPDIKYFYFDSIDSTNNEAKRRIERGLVKGIELIRASAQTTGRGRQGKSFYSPADTGIYMTVTIPVNRPIASQVTMTTRTAVAVAEAIEDIFKIATSIKWVNDIYVGTLKCCGILCEAVNDYDTGIMKYAVVGVGINISTSEWPKELEGIAGSLDVETFDADDAAQKIAVRIAESFSNLDGTEYLEYYRKHSNVLGREVVFTQNGKTCEGLAHDINDDGSLAVTVKESGSFVEYTLNSGEITLRTAGGGR